MLEHSKHGINSLLGIGDYVAGPSDELSNLSLKFLVLTQVLCAHDLRSICPRAQSPHELLGRELSNKAEPCLHSKHKIWPRDRNWRGDAHADTGGQRFFRWQVADGIGCAPRLH